MSAFGNTTQKLPTCFVELIKADVAYDEVKRQNPIDLQSLKDAKEDKRRWKRACEVFVSSQKAGNVA